MVKKKILLFGATGMAGHMAYYYLQCTGKYDLVNVVYRTQLTDDSIVVDVTDGDAVSRLVREVRPDFILNCIGVLISVTTLELAKAIDVAIDQGVTGLIQLSNGLGISKYDLLHLFSRIWHKRDVEILPFDGNGIDKSIAKSARFSYVVPGYEEMLREQYDWMQNKQELYRTLYL